jgi:hypothetical protein
VNQIYSLACFRTADLLDSHVRTHLSSLESQQLPPFGADTSSHRVQNYYTVADILYYTILYYTILYYTILYYTILYYTVLYYT